MHQHKINFTERFKKRLHQSGQSGTKRCRVSTLTKNLKEEHKRRKGFAKTDI